MGEISLLQNQWLKQGMIEQILLMIEMGTLPSQQRRPLKMINQDTKMQPQLDKTIPLHWYLLIDREIKIICSILKWEVDTSTIHHLRGAINSSLKLIETLTQIIRRVFLKIITAKLVIMLLHSNQFKKQDPIRTCKAAIQSDHNT